VEEIEPLAKNLRLVVGFDPQSLLGMKRSEATLQVGQNVLGHVEPICLWTMQRTLEFSNPSGRDASTGH
jgi:hypothetical protein